MNLDENLILIKGQNKTGEISDLNYKNDRIFITYKNGRTYPYRPSNVVFLKKQRDIDISNSIVFRNNQQLSNVAQLQDFGQLLRIVFKSGYTELCKPYEIKITASCLTDTKSKNVFEYLRHIAHAVSLNWQQVPLHCLVQKRLL